MEIFTWVNEKGDMPGKNIVLLEMAEEYCEKHKRSGKAKALKKHLDNALACF